MEAKDALKRFEGVRIGVLMGGISSEREVSLRTGAAVLESLERLGLSAVEIDAGRDICRRVEEEGIGMAFIALHGKHGEDGAVQGAMELLGVPYTGSGVASSALAMNKPLAKTLARAAGIDTPDWTTVRAGEEKKMADMEPPVVVKPAASGSSIGVTICRERGHVAPAIEDALREGGAAMVEVFVEGRLVTVGILGDRVLPPIEIEAASGFYDYDSKYTPGRSEYHVPARLDSAALERVERAAMKAHRTLGCAGFSRSELIVDEAGKTWFLELNTIPGMTKTSLLPMAAKAAGLSFDDLVLTILKEASSGLEA
ncbi:MAG: D-alanine--D-alanine ligase [Candidatus Nitrospinota bacterium M3_3B_026]